MNTISIENEVSQNFIDFSHEANCQRAFADARDGLKPGQRACLWEMFIKGYSSNKPHVKSAKISGGTIATWWPHGDVAIYDTFARMSQPWINNMPEVDWHGANGSIQISGEPAASRYTEARLSKIAEEGLFYNIKKHNVPMKLNFSEDEEWPEVLPAIIPRLMINGCQGIGSTIANVWLPHSLNDLAKVIDNYLSTGKLDYSNLAPSFPTGGIIINKNDIHKIYETGKGKVIVRGKAEIKDNLILITEIPYQVYVEPLIDQIKELIQKDEITGISNILNKSDKKKLLIEIECDRSPGSVLANLYKKTNLQKSYSANQYALVGKTPRLLNLKEYLDIYIQHNIDCIIREATFDRDKALARLEVVEGLLIALADIDNIINIIKKSDSTTNAKESLIKRYEFTNNQVTAILNMKLSSLAKLEGVKLENEKEDLKKEIKRLDYLIVDKSTQHKEFQNRFDKIVKKYGDVRRTELAQIEIPKEEKEIAFVEPKDVVVFCTKGGYIKRIPKENFKPQRKNGKGLKNKDDAVLASISTNTTDTLMIFTKSGKMYRMLVDDVPEGTNATKGTSLFSLLSLENNDDIVMITSLYYKTKAKYIVFFTKNGLIKKTKLEEYTGTKKKTGIQAIKIKDGDGIANVTFLADEKVVLVTKKGFAIKFETKSIDPTSRVTMGVKGIKLAEGDEVLLGLPVHDEVNDYFTVVTEDGCGRRLKIKNIPLQNKGGIGTKVCADGKKIAAAAMLAETDEVVIIGTPNNICISAKDIPVLENRMTEGSKLINGSKVNYIIKL